MCCNYSYVTIHGVYIASAFIYSIVSPLLLLLLLLLLRDFPVILNTPA
jgi:hypothetical protein